MQPCEFPGSTVIGKPADMTDEQCSPIYATNGINEQGFPYFLTAWKPSYEDLEALKRGKPIYIKTISRGLPPMAIFTIDENGECNDAS